MIIQSVHFVFAPEDSDNAERMFRELRDLSRDEVGVISFDVARGEQKPNVFALWEVYRDKAALDAHLASEHFNRLVINGVRPLAQQRDGEVVSPI